MVYDVENGSRLAQLDTGKSWRGSANYVHVTPDERFMLTTKERFAKIEYFDKDNQPMKRYTGAQSIRRWNLETGELLWTDKRPDQGRIVMLKLSPTGNVFVMEEQIAGEFPRSTQEQRRAFYGETSTGMLHPLPPNLSGFGLFSPDGKVFATFQKTSEDIVQSIHLLDGTNFRELASWPVAEPLSNCYFKEMTAKKQLLYQQQVFARKDKWNDTTTRLMMLDLSQAQSKPQILLPDLKNCPLARLSHDQNQLLYITKEGYQYELKQMDLLNPSKVRSTPLPSEPKRLYGSTCTQSHHGKYLALAHWAEIPKELLGEDQITPEQVGQPRIILVEVATGKVVETLVSPHAFLAGLAFSPDDKTLASSGQGCIHLWDLSHLK